MYVGGESIEKDHIEIFVKINFFEICLMLVEREIRGDDNILFPRCVM